VRVSVLQSLCCNATAAASKGVCERKGNRHPTRPTSSQTSGGKKVGNFKIESDKERFVGEVSASYDLSNNEKKQRKLLFSEPSDVGEECWLIGVRGLGWQRGACEPPTRVVAACSSRGTPRHRAHAQPRGRALRGSRGVASKGVCCTQIRHRRQLCPHASSATNSRIAHRHRGWRTPILDW